jgi:hypothetical protein
MIQSKGGGGGERGLALYTTVKCRLAGSMNYWVI